MFRRNIPGFYGWADTLASSIRIQRFTSCISATWLPSSENAGTSYNVFKCVIVRTVRDTQDAQNTPSCCTLCSFTTYKLPILDQSWIALEYKSIVLQLSSWSPGRIPQVNYPSNSSCFIQTISTKCVYTSVTTAVSIPVKFLSKLNYYFFGYFDPTHIFFDNKNK